MMIYESNDKIIMNKAKCYIDFRLQINLFSKKSALFSIDFYISEKVSCMK